jgi:integrase
MPVAKLCPPSLIGFGVAFFRDLSPVLTDGTSARSTLHLTAYPGYKLPLHPQRSKNGRLAVRVHLKGVHSVRKRLATGKTETYYYAWRGGPRIAAELGTSEFVRLYSEAYAKRKLPPPGTLFTLIAEFKASAEFEGKEPSTKRAYLSYLKLIEAEFGDMPIAALNDPEVRGVFKTWRDGMAATPRKADYAWTTLARVLSVAKDRGRIPINPCERGGRLYEAERSDKVWTETDIGRLLSVAGPRIEAALLLALWTGQRQGDLLRLPWSAYDGKHIRLRQNKGGRRLKIPVGGPLRAQLEAISRVSPTMLTNSYGAPWTSDGFRTSWGKACAKAGITDLTFHDLRGSAVTRLAIAGCSVPEIASITGHSLKDVEDILDKHYLSRDQALAENAIEKLERRTKTVN